MSDPCTMSLRIRSKAFIALSLLLLGGAAIVAWFVLGGEGAEPDVQRVLGIDLEDAASDPARPELLRLSGTVITYYSAAEEWELLAEFEDPRVVRVQGARVVVEGEEGCEIPGPRAELSGPGEVRGYELQHHPETCESIYLYGKVKP